MMSAKAVVAKAPAWLGGAVLVSGLSFALLAPPVVQGGEKVRRQAADRARFDLRRLDEAIRESRAAAAAAGDNGERDLAHRMSRFARRVSELRDRIEGGHASPARIEHDLRKLADDSRGIQREAARNRRADPAVVEGWSRVVRVVDDISRGDRGLRGTSGGMRGDERPTDRDRDRDRGHEEEGDRIGDYPPASLPSDLDRRIRRAETLAGQMEVGDARSSVERFAERASRSIGEFSGLSAEDRQERMRSLLREAREVQRSLTRHNASPELVDEWNGVVDVLARTSGRR